MEDIDGFVRTLSDSEAPLPGTEDEDADDDSCLGFGSEASDEESTAKSHDRSSSQSPFFEVSAPHAWDLRGARDAASELHPFQTTIDEKIKRVRATLGSSSDKDIFTDKEHQSSDLIPTEVDDDQPKIWQGTKLSPDLTLANDDDDRNPKSPDPDRDNHGSSGDLLAVKDRKGKKRMRKEAKTALVTFDQLHLSKALLKAIAELDWKTPTPIQARAIPCILAGRDVSGSAVTGSGKTAAFILPLLERLLRSGIDNVTRVIILLPTRELAAQCHAVALRLSKYTSIRAALAVGGLSNKAQEVALRSRPHIIVATPGRLIDHARNAHGFSLDEIEILVMDEADRLLEMGFKDEIEEIVRLSPASGKQTILFSATMNPKVQSLAKLSLQNPIHIAVDPLFDVASTLSQEFIKLKPLHEPNKDAYLFALVKRSFRRRTIIFFRQKVTAHRFKILFGLCDLRCAELHGNLTQGQRLEALDVFREGMVDFLLCTDLAARGLDVAGVEAVINFDMPSDVTEYVHRVGRTARAGAAGRACTIVCSSSNDERKVLRSIAKRANGQLSARIIQPAVIGKWRAWIDSRDDAVKTILKEERHEKELRLAEMELSKADNILKHSDEIYSRPARTWFQSEKQKDNAKGAARAAKGFAPRIGSETASKEPKKTKAQAIQENLKSKARQDQERDFAQQRAAKSRIAKRRKIR